MVCVGAESRVWCLRWTDHCQCQIQGPCGICIPQPHSRQVNTQIFVLQVTSLICFLHILSEQHFLKRLSPFILGGEASLWDLTMNSSTQGPTLEQLQKVRTAPSADWTVLTTWVTYSSINTVYLCVAQLQERREAELRAKREEEERKRRDEKRRQQQEEQKRREEEELFRRKQVRNANSL